MPKAKTLKAERRRKAISRTIKIGIKEKRIVNAFTKGSMYWKNKKLSNKHIHNISIGTKKGMNNSKTKKKLSDAGKARKPSKQQKNKTSKSMKVWHKKNKYSKENKLRIKRISRKLRNKTYEDLHGVKEAKKIKKKISLAGKNRKTSNKTRKKLSKANKGNKKLKRSLRKFNREIGASKRTRKKLSKSTKKLWKNPEYRKKCTNKGWKMHWRGRKKISLSKIGNKNPAKRFDVRKKIGKTSKKRWKDSNYRNKYLKALREHPNKSEKKLILILKKLKIYFDFVGNGTKWITSENNKRHNPDYINEEKHKIIEFDGIYWHRTKKENDKIRNKAYKKAEYSVLVLHEEDLLDLNKLKIKLINFYKK